MEKLCLGGRLETSRQDFNEPSTERKIMNRNQQRKKARKVRKHREMFWSSQPDIRPILSKSTVRMRGGAQIREFRNSQFQSGERIVIESSDALGRLNSTGTRVVSSRFYEQHTGRTWVKVNP